jgi:hypothetical protein
MKTLRVLLAGILVALPVCLVSGCGPSTGSSGSTVRGTRVVPADDPQGGDSAKLQRDKGQRI